MNLKKKMLACLILLIKTSVCQASADDSLRTAYGHGLNTDAWIMRFGFESYPDSGSALQIFESAEASRLKFASGRNKWKDQHIFRIQWTRFLSSGLTWNLQGNHSLFSDKQIGFENDIETLFIATGATVQSRMFSLPAVLGLKRDERLRQSDTGFSYQTGLRTQFIEIRDYVHWLNADLAGDYLGGRKNTDQSLRYRVSRNFFHNTADTMNVEIQGLRRDYYINTAGELESREDNGRSIDNHLQYPIGEDMVLNVIGRVSTHQLKINMKTGSEKKLKRDRRDTEIFGSVRLRWEKNWMEGDLLFSSLSREENYQLEESLPSSPYSGSSLLKTPDNQYGISSYSLKTKFYTGYSDTLSLSANFQKFQYDTPDEDNFDDRDEIRLFTDIGYKHRLSPNLTVNGTLRLYLLHLVYIYGEKSADNNWKRIIQMEPSIDWEPAPGWRWKQAVSLLSNYVDYDFDSEMAGIRSFLYRKFEIEDSVEIPLGSRSGVLLDYRLELDENGKLIWDDWLEEKLVERKSHTLEFHLRFQPVHELWIQPGYSFYSRTGYRYLTRSDGTQDKEKHMAFQSHGPCLRWTYSGKRLHLKFSAQTIRTQTMDVSRQIYTQLNFSMHWLF